MRYEFKCECGQVSEVVCSHKDYNSHIPTHCGVRMDWVPGRHGFKFTYVAGRETGVYAYDYGKCATYDLTVPGKIERLKKDGVIQDPFDSAPKRTETDSSSYWGDDTKDVVR